MSHCDLVVLCLLSTPRTGWSVLPYPIITPMCVCTLTVVCVYLLVVGSLVPRCVVGAFCILRQDDCCCMKTLLLQNILLFIVCWHAFSVGLLLFCLLNPLLTDLYMPCFWECSFCVLVLCSYYYYRQGCACPALLLLFSFFHATQQWAGTDTALALWFFCSFRARPILLCLVIPHVCVPDFIPSVMTVGKTFYLPHSHLDH